MKKLLYLWVRPENTEQSLVIIDNPLEIFEQFNLTNHRLYRLGEEVKFNLSLDVVGNTRSIDVKTISSGCITYTNPELTTYNDDPDGVGNYRG